MIRLAHPNLGFIIPLNDNQLPVLVLENPSFYRKCVSDIQLQENGRDGDFVLSREWEPIPIGKNGIIITDPFNIDLNSRKIITAIVKLMMETANSEKHYMESLEIQNAVNRYWQSLENDIPLPIIHEIITDPSALIKLANVRIDVENHDLPFIIATMIKMAAEILRLKVMFFVGLHTYLTGDEISVIMKMADYQQMHLVNIEARVPTEVKSFEKLYIVDSEMCEIYTE